MPKDPQSALLQQGASIVEFDDTSYSYPNSNGNRALDSITLAIREGEFVCILGSNGSGKSTLARHMNGLIVPTAGEVRVSGRPTSDAKSLADTRCTVGMVFQSPDDQIVASFVEDDVAFGPENLGLPPEEIRARVTEALHRVGLDGFERRSVHALSGGQKQRVAIAGALAMRPKVLVLDEAESMLDPQGRESLAAACRDLHRAGITIVFITHSAEAATMAQRVVVLDQGRIALQGTPEEVLGQQDRLESLGLTAPFAVRLSCKLRALGRDVGVHTDIDSLARAIAQP